MTTDTKSRLTRDLMAHRIADEFEDGWIANLGVGMPTLCSDFVPAEKFVVLHSENGVIGYGRGATVEEATPYVVNPGVAPVLMHPYTSNVHHADAFRIIRKGLLDVAVLGAYEVAANGDFANWKMAGRHGGGIGGAMDLAAGAKRVFVMMEHLTKAGESKIVERLSYPVTALACVDRVYTDLAVIDVTPRGLAVREIVDGLAFDALARLTGVALIDGRSSG